VADKQITVQVPEERVAEFYAWFAEFLSAPVGGLGPSPGRWGGPRGRPGRHGPERFGGTRGLAGEPSPWTERDLEQASWVYRKLSDPARALFDLLIDNPGVRFSGNDIATRLKLEKGSHGVAGVLAWPGRWCRKLGREFPIDTDAREDGGTDFMMGAATAAVFDRARTAGAEPGGAR